MKRFKSVNIQNLFSTVLDCIFNIENKTPKEQFGGFRKQELGRVNSSFFSFVFLCGGNRKEYQSRETLLSILRKNKNVKIIISEDLSDYKGNLDLLIFEATLEAISKMILIPVESFGTACELGAFTRMKKSDNKVVAIIDKNRASEPSFINFGPIEYLRNMEDDRVLTCTFTKRLGKTYLCSNSKIRTLFEHKLIKTDNKIVNYLSVDESANTGQIIDLFSFFVAIIDLICLVGFVNTEFIMNFFYRRFNVGSIYIKTNNIDGNEQTLKDMINTLLNILVSIEFLKKNGSLFEVNEEKMIMKDASNKERWIGRVLFTRSFTSTDEYLRIKAYCRDVKRKIDTYGYY